MNYILTPYAIAQFATAGVAIIVSVIMWKRRNSRGGWALFLLFVAISEWTFANGFEAMGVAQDTKILWSKFAYFGAQTSPVFLLIFALTYTGKVNRIHPAFTGLLFLIPSLVIGLAATNEAHQLVWTDFTPGPTGTNSLIYHHGPIFWLGIVYIFSLVAFSTTIFLVSTVQSQKIYRFQHFIIIAASFTPWIGAIIYIFDVNPFPGLDITSISFLFTGLFLLVGFSRGSLMNYIPVAHEILVENIRNGIIVFDENLRIIDMNPEAENQLSLKFNEVVGKSPKQNAALWANIGTYFKQFSNSRFEMISPRNKNIWFSVSISPIHNHHKKFIGWVSTLEDITERKKTENELQESNQRLEKHLKEIQVLQEQLREQATRDSLTGVFNRGYLEETLSREIARAERKNYPLSLIMLDIDFFKKINDSYGHKVGDRVVVALGKMLQSQTRKVDCVSRYGGDEFIMIMPEMSTENAFKRAEVWRKDCKDLIVPGPGKNFQFTISIGIASYPKDGKDNNSLLGAVDQALYEAKQSGRDCTRIAGD